jgi:starvation-inducible DNA-binding protein
LIHASRLGADPDSVAGIVSILADHEAFIRFLREDSRKCSEIYDDQGTFALLVNVLRSHEKMAWMLRSNLPSGPFDV